MWATRSVVQAPAMGRSGISTVSTHPANTLPRPWPNTVAGMGEGPALTLLLAGPALSLPNMLAIRSVLGNQKTAVYVALVVVLSTTAGVIYGNVIV